MAVDIGACKSDDDEISLYDIFSIEAEMEHNSYFHQIFDIIGEIEDGESENEETDSLNYMFLIYILTAFLDVYYNF